VNLPSVYSLAAGLAGAGGGKACCPCAEAGMGIGMGTGTGIGIGAKMWLTGALFGSDEGRIILLLTCCVCCLAPLGSTVSGTDMGIITGHPTLCFEPFSAPQNSQQFSLDVVAILVPFLVFLINSIRSPFGCCYL
jgi:hypothetical protein